MKTAKQTVELIDVMGNDLSVVNAARVSFHKVSDAARNCVQGYLYAAMTWQGRPLVALDRDHTLTMYCEADHVSKVPEALEYIVRGEGAV